jgi:hypothetical protein
MNKASLQFHIEKNDLFGTLATVLDLVSQDLARRRYHRHAETLIELRDQLVYLQESHRITRVGCSSDPNRIFRPGETVSVLAMDSPQPAANLECGSPVWSNIGRVSPL